MMVDLTKQENLAKMLGFPTNPTNEIVKEQPTKPITEYECVLCKAPAKVKTDSEYLCGNCFYERVKECIDISEEDFKEEGLISDD